MSSSKILFFLCVSFVAGISLQSFLKMPQTFVWGFLASGVLIIAVSLFLNKNSLIVFGFCLLFFSLGIIRLQIADFNILGDKLSKYNDKPENIILTGVISDDPDVRDTSEKLKVTVGKSIILVTADKYPEYQYLDRIKITGKLKTPPVADDFNYKNYLMKDGIYSVMNFPKIELVGKEGVSFYRNPVSVIYSGILWFKGKLTESIHKNYLPPESLILEGIILGNNKTMTQDLRDKLSKTGLRYLTAISGVHVIILSGILFSFLMMFGVLSRQRALCLSLFLVWLYVALTGFTASGIRAAIMGSLFILAQVFGRQNTSSRTITIAAALMLLQNPLLLFYDVGFQLSYLASLGIIYLKPIIGRLFEKFKKIYSSHAWTSEFFDMVFVTLSAQLATAPVMVFNFGNVPLVGPVTSILALPAIPMILIFGFASSILGIFFDTLSWIFSLPCRILLVYFIKILDIFSAPWMSKTILNVSWIWLAVYYFAIIFLIWFFNKEYGKNFV